jgi:CDP-glucose 4,6-dehydratase
MEGLEVSAAFWRGKRVFVTGHTGFKGTWLCRWLLRLGANVVGYALAPSTSPSLFAETSTARDVTSISADIRDGEQLHSALSTNKPEVVFHLAAQSLVSEAYAHPIETYSTNVMGTVHLLQALRARPETRAAVIVTSDKCYEPSNSGRRHREDDPLGGSDPYSSSKACAEHITAAFRCSFFANSKHDRAVAALATARAGNVIGGGDWSPHRLIPDAVAAFVAGRPLELRNPNAVRPWQHVLDPLRAYLLLAQRLWKNGQDFASAWNFGPPESNELAVEALIQEFAKAWGTAGRWRSHISQPSFVETQELRLNSERAQTRLGWCTRIALPQALSATAHWYQAHLSGDSAAALVESDIGQFEAACVQ